MAIITRKQEVCDVCKDPDRETDRYRVGKYGEVRTVALCEEHAKPIHELVAKLGMVIPRTSKSSKVTTLEEIERIKAERAKVRHNGKK